MVPQERGGCLEGHGDRGGDAEDPAAGAPRGPGHGRPAEPQAAVQQGAKKCRERAVPEGFIGLNISSFNQEKKNSIFIRAWQFYRQS